MNNGGGENGRQDESEPKKRPDGDEFGREVAKVAVAQICESVGFHGFQQSALEAVSDIAIRYLRDLGKTAHFYANLAGRTDCNVFDIFQGLEDFAGTTQGFSCASDVNHCLLGSGTVCDIKQYVQLREEIPFVKSIPHFPVARNTKPIPSFAQLGEAPPGMHIPDWLPAFPDPHTYIHTPLWNERASDPKTDKTEQAKQRRKAESSLLSLQQRIAGGAAVQATVCRADVGKDRSDFEGNPFLGPPLQFWEKEVSPVIPPEKLSNEARIENSVSLLETFAPAFEAYKSGVCDNVENERMILPNKRPTLHFRFGVDKKFVTPLSLSGRNSGAEKIASLFGKDDEKDEKKRRAEQILKEAMENPRDLPQL